MGDPRVLTGEGWEVWAGDCREVMRSLPDASFDAVVTDPPYGLEFMGKEWDAPWKGDVRQIGDATFQQGESRNGKVRHGMSRSYGGDTNAQMVNFQQWFTEVATEALRVLKPGGHLLAFGGPRTWHRLAVAIEDAGFEIRDSIAWIYGTGFPKSLDVSKAIDKVAGAERERVVQHEGVSGCMENPRMRVMDAGDPITAAAQQWEGWGTALKPAHEPIVVARKPLIGTVAENVLAHGTGGLNIDGCRIAGDVPSKPYPLFGVAKGVTNCGAGTGRNGEISQATGRWPANVILDESQAAELNRQSEHDDTGGASRFFYVPKAGSAERPREGDTAHPTVKPLDLMRYLVRLVTPPGGRVLDPFAGTGTTLEAAIIEGFHASGVEQDPTYLPLIRQRLTKPIQPVIW